MGKKSKQARKIGKIKSKDKDTSDAGVYERFLTSVPRRVPDATACRHLPSGIVVKENQRKELHEYLGIKRRGNQSEYDELKLLIVKWAGQYQHHCVDPSCSASMPEFVLATLTDYLLEYEHGNIRNQLLDLLLLHSALEEVINSGLMAEYQRDSTGDKGGLLLKITQLISTGMQRVMTAKVGESEYSMIRFLDKKIPCDCLKDARLRLKHLAPETTHCMNPSCDLEEMEVHQTLLCSRCKAALYCSAACQREHWKEHKLICKEIEKTSQAD